MNILKPDLVWVKDRCYRKLPIREELRSVDLYDRYPDVSDQPFTYEEIQGENEYSEVDVKSDGNKFWTRIAIPSALLGKIIGKNFANIKRIQEQTRTTITPPSNKTRDSNAPSSETVITAEFEKAVRDAYVQLSTIAASARWSIPFTHFISFPMNHANLQESFLEFKNHILKNYNGVRGIDESIFQKPQKLHLTVTTLTLLDDRERAAATSILQMCKIDIIAILANKPLDVLVKGVEYMNDDPSEVDVLYAKVHAFDDDDDSLQIIADKLAQTFIKAKFSKLQYESVKLHMTLMNSSFRGEFTKETPTHLSQARTVIPYKDKDSFDARKIIEDYGNYVFGKVPFNEIHISVRHQAGKDGYYSSTSAVTI